MVVAVGEVCCLMPVALMVVALTMIFGRMVELLFLGRGSNRNIRRRR